MCNALWECIKCPGRVVCCCCECACNVLIGILSSVIILLVVIGLIVYFCVYYNNDSDTDEAQKIAKRFLDEAPSFRDYFKSIQ